MKKALIISSIIFVVSIIAFGISVAVTGLRESNFSLAIGFDKVLNDKLPELTNTKIEPMTHHFDSKEQVKDIEIDILSADAVIEVADVDEITVDYKGDTGNVIETYVEGNTLVVKETENFVVTLISWDFSGNGSNLKITLPAKEYDDVVINVASGDIDINGLISRHFDANSASGDLDYNIFADDIKVSTLSGCVELTNCTDKKAMSLHLTSTSGDHEINGFTADKFVFDSVSGCISASGISGKGEVNITSGDIELVYSEWDNDLEISAISGSVDVTLPEDSGVIVQLSAASGGVDVDLMGESEDGSSRAIFSGNCTSGEIGGSNVHQVEANLMSGDVDIHN